MQQSRNWVFTINNPANDELPHAFEGRYCIWQRESGENGTPHLQGYIVFSGNKRLANLKKLDPNAHWEPRRGSHDQAKQYASKDDTRVAGPWSYGDEPRQGSRNDLLAVKKAIDSGASETEIAHEFFTSWTKSYRAFREYRLLTTPSRTTKTHVCVIYGPTNVGKTTTIMRAHPAAFWLPRPTVGSNLWFDRYDCNPVLVVDEFYGWIPYDFLLRLCDFSPLSVQTKCGTLPFVSKLIVFSSNKHPRDWYNYEKFSNGYAPLERRIDWLVEAVALDDHRIVRSPSTSSGSLGRATLDWAVVKEKAGL